MLKRTAEQEFKTLKTPSGIRKSCNSYALIKKQDMYLLYKNYD